ncbi:SAM-dependent methyltransferase [Lactobacillus mulieris]|jgi:SAM-dependent methyltransferase|uniref:hypothetical protein n=1 Tax=Lactobacillus TaxID=1578 RepID=UPI00019C7FDD|nr:MULTISPECIES: hypothetical protein [Lactobacillus]EEU21420.1 hypothetical protein HMPREF0525_00354 [Lactobacillus jensenii 27-2-CHN]EEX24291.1 hypothetical protein HMPREF0974_00096 [Lactobacillus jensenii 115-3-CHN]EFH29459.1 hypothetical protein HMPREF0526_11062 [Lactobacillus jensenii JV-V16]KAA9244544.1 SAM-dependent methyltransferase [Lactobacillus jensenii]KAA9370301.1 SAM-dependent methyltransferase [Lactobacillus jensenii]
MTDFLTKLIKIDNELNIPRLHQEVCEVKRVCSVLDKKEVPNCQIMNLGPITAQKSAAKKIQVANNLLNSFRQYLSLHYGLWSLPNVQTARIIKEKYNITSAVEVMAGNAAWSKALSMAGVKVYASDNLVWSKTSKTGGDLFYPVENLDASSAIIKYQNCDLIICSWAPNFGHADIDLIKVWKKLEHRPKLLFVGEEFGVTNSEEFWQTVSFIKKPELASVNASFSSFDFIEERFFEIDED